MGQTVSLASRLRADRLGRPAAVAFWGALPALLIVFALADLGHTRTHWAGDMHYAYWPAARAVLHGQSPYPDPGAGVVSSAKAFVYPAPAAWFFAPWGLLPRTLADALFLALNLLAPLAALALLRVRDWRVYGATALALPVFSGWLVANVSLLLALGLAAAWRHRDRPALLGLWLALLVSCKVFLWPLLLWLPATRRYRHLGWAVAAGIAINVAAWGALGFSEVGRYTRLLHALTHAEERKGFSLVSLGLRAGAGDFAAYGVAFALAAAAIAAAAMLGRRGGDGRALVLCLAASLLASPIVQFHYFALLLIPLAIVRPRLDRAWYLPLGFWLCGHGAPWQVALTLALGGALVVASLGRTGAGWHTYVPSISSPSATAGVPSSRS